jgi:hypothetical protein
MTRGFYMKLNETSRSERELAFLVLASGWDVEASDIAEIGELVVNVKSQTASFSPSGPWLTDVVVAPFVDVPLEPRQSYGLWMRWLLELGAKALTSSENLTRFI